MIATLEPPEAYVLHDLDADPEEAVKVALMHLMAQGALRLNGRDAVAHIGRHGPGSLTVTGPVVPAGASRS